MLKIAFDEAGNTGPNLLDNEQRIYALSSVNFSSKGLEELLSLFKTKSLHCYTWRASPPRRKDDKHHKWLIIKAINLRVLAASR